MSRRRRAPGFGFWGVTPNAHRCLRQARVYLWHAWTCIKQAVKWQFKGY